MSKTYSNETLTKATDENPIFHKKYLTSKLVDKISKIMAAIVALIGLVIIYNTSMDNKDFALASLILYLVSMSIFFFGHLIHKKMAAPFLKECESIEKTA